MIPDRAWIYDFDGLAFESYEDGRSAASLKGHTRQGEIIVHRDGEGTLSVISNQTIEPWPADHHYEVFQRPWYPDDFT